MNPKSEIIKVFILLLIILLLQPSCCQKVALSEDRKNANETNTSEWLAYGRSHSKQRFSPLTDINTNTVKSLAVDWFVDLPTDKALVSTPLVADGVLTLLKRQLPAGVSDVYAYNQQQGDTSFAGGDYTRP